MKSKRRLRIALVLTLVLVGVGGASIVMAHADGYLIPCGYSRVAPHGLQPTVLHVTRSAVLAWGRLPVNRCVHDAAAVQRLQTEAYKSPPAPPRLCLSASRPSTYELDFIAGDTLVQHMSLRYIGCLTLVIDGDPVGRVPSREFLPLFSQMVGIRIDQLLR
jgi:hypothetical protein